MDKNTLVGFILMGAVIFAFSWFNRPTAEQLERVKKEQDSLVQVEAKQLQAIEQSTESLPIIPDTTVSILPDSALIQNQLQDKFGAFANVIEGKEESFVIENEVLALTFSTKGGVIKKAVLKDYKSYTGQPLILFDGNDNQYGFTFLTNNNRYVNSTELYFTPIVNKEKGQVTMRLNLGQGRVFDLNYSLLPEEYMVQLNITQQGMDQVLSLRENMLRFYWEQDMRRQEKGRVFEERYSQLYYKFLGDDIEKLSESKNENETVTTKLKWVGFKNQFFSTVFISDQSFNGAVLDSKILKDSDKYLKKMRMESDFDYSPAQNEVVGLKLFLGPNSYPLLSAYDKDLKGDDELNLDKLVPLGASIFRFINVYLVIPLFTFFGKFISNYGIIILLLTLVIKIIISPLTYKSYLSSAKMRVLRPQIQAINEKYPGQDKAMERQKATMDLYSKAGINPMGGCLPMLLQMPILFALFSFFPSSIELRQESFLWATDLSSYDAIVSWNTYIPIITPYFGNHISLFCLLMTITNILYTKMSMADNAGQQQMPGMKFMMYAMPLMFLFIFNNYSSGLSYYYLLSTLITIGQTFVMRRIVNEEKLLAKLHENSKKPKKKSSFMARLEEAQRQQQAMMEQQQKQKQQQNKRK